MATNAPRKIKPFSKQLVDISHIINAFPLSNNTHKTEDRVRKSYKKANVFYSSARSTYLVKSLAPATAYPNQFGLFIYSIPQRFGCLRKYFHLAADQSNFSFRYRLLIILSNPFDLRSGNLLFKSWGSNENKTRRVEFGWLITYLPFESLILRAYNTLIRWNQKLCFYRPLPL